MSAPNGNVSQSVLRLGVIAPVFVVTLECAYAITLVLGLTALEAASDPIGDPYFTIMELLIIAMMPAFIVLTITIHTICGLLRRHYALAATIFVTILAALTSSVHASILVLSRDPAFAGMSDVFSFEWPSLVYVLDILAWDFFFGFYAVFLALSFERNGLEGWIRRVLFLSGILALAGLLGVAVGDMNIRNIGIVGYVGVFTIAAILVAVWMLRRLLLAR